MLKNRRTLVYSRVTGAEEVSMQVIAHVRARFVLRDAARIAAIPIAQLARGSAIRCARRSRRKLRSHYLLKCSADLAGGGGMLRSGHPLVIPDGIDGFLPALKRVSLS